MKKTVLIFVHNIMRHLILHLFKEVTPKTKFKSLLLNNSLHVPLSLNKRFYTRGTLASKIIPQLATILTLYRNWLRSLN